MADKQNLRKPGEDFEGISLDDEHCILQRHLKTPVGPYSLYGFREGDKDAYFMASVSEEGALEFLSWGPSHGKAEFYKRIGEQAKQEQSRHEMSVKKLQRLRL